MIGKKHFRCHAHTNSFKDTNIVIPDCPESIEWDKYFENGVAPKNVDIGCGYGKFLTQVSKLDKEENILGIEIRDKVVDYVKIISKEISNCSVVKTNGLLFLVNFFKAASLRKIFILFPDPHFKKRKQKGRMVCKQTINIFEYLLEDRGRVYISTDVSELFEYMCGTFDESSAFRKIEDDDELFRMSYKDTDEAHRAGVKSGKTFGRIYEVVKTEKM